MIRSIHFSAPQYDPSAAQPSHAAAPTRENQNAGELTTVTTHCDQNHWHTPSCPHTVVTRPAHSMDGKGQYLDVFA